MRKDLIYHFTAGFITAELAQVLGPNGMILSSTMAGAGKELYDKYYKKEKFDVADLFATFIGGFTATWLEYFYFASNLGWFYNTIM